MVLFVFCLGASIFGVLVLERFVKPRADMRPILNRLSLLSAMPTIVFYISLYMISYRPVFSLVATVVAFGAIVTVNNAKYAALKEPLVFSDFALLRQAVQHPRLYVKYIGTWKLLLIGIAVAGTIAAATFFEPPTIARATIEDYVPTLLYLFVVVGMIYAVTHGPFRGMFLQLLRRFGAETDVRRDIERLSLVVVLIFYFVLANEPEPRPAPVPTDDRLKPPPKPRPAPAIWPAGLRRLPPIVTVQNESFFDARRLGPMVAQGAFAGWDQISAQSAYFGRLAVPAWGANTMRTEFAFLSGLPNEALNLHRFNPYLHLCKRPVWTIAHELRAIGYRTIIVHPFARTFFGRDRVYANLGFDEFVDIGEFQNARTFGPYISDGSVAEKIIELLAGPGPIFIFAITMENHGRWERGRLNDVLLADELGDPPLGSEAFGLYLRHLVNADAMAAQLVDALADRTDNPAFCMFGDHLPSLPEVFNVLDYQDPRTDYLIWRKEVARSCRLDTSIDTLGRLILHVALSQQTREEPTRSAGSQRTAMAGRGNDDNA